MMNAQVLPDGQTMEGAVVTVRCLKPIKYVLIGGNEVTCQSNEEWSDEPECRKCGKDMIINIDFDKTR